MNKGLLKILKKLSTVAFGFSVMSANTTSLWASHQPEIDDSVKKLKKL
ncbi:MAG: cyclic lactone autoinducer peptide [Clostridiales bacterium]|nr:cyclic lactone autoinducer peptide [Clostridiales bacterium]